MSGGKLPEGWGHSTISNAISNSGLISDGDWIESKDQDQNGSVKLIQLADIGDGVFRNKSERYMTPDKASQLKCTYLSSGDVLVARMPDPLGRACIFPGLDKKSVTVVDVCLFRTSTTSAITNTLLKYWLNSPALRTLISEHASGTTRKRITRKKLEQLEIPIPSIAEQKIIAEKLDTLLAQVDSTKTRLEIIPRILKRFRQAVLTAAVNGELTEDWRNKVKESLDFKKVNFELILTELRNGLSSKPNEKGLGYPILRISSVRSSQVDQSDIRYLECSEAELERHKLKEGDLLFTRYNGSLEFVGVCGLLKKTQHKDLLYPDKLIRARLKKDVLPEYIEIFFSSPGARNAMMKCVKTTSGQKGISGKDIKSQLVSLPSLKEQHEIVRRVEQLFAYADTIEKQVNSALTRVNNLTQSILAKAFRGELTAQWRAENPDLISGENSAAALLERIKAERTASGGKKTSRKKS